MTVKIFVGRLAEGTTRDDLVPLFKKFGAVKECDVLSSYGFVHMDSEEEASVAIAALDGYSVRGSHIHVELSTTTTQGRKKKIDSRPFGGSRLGPVQGPNFSHGNRFEPYHSRHGPPPQATTLNIGPIVPIHAPADRLALNSQAQMIQKEEYASEQVKDLLELYFRDPYSFDQYAKTYYYGERLERLSAARTYDRRLAPEGPSFTAPNVLFRR